LIASGREALDQGRIEAAAFLAQQATAFWPDAAEGWRLTSEVHRVQGDLHRAASAVQSWRRCAPDDPEAAFVETLLAGGALPALPAGVLPAPFALIDEALSESQRYLVFDTTYEQLGQMADATVMAEDGDYRNDAASRIAKVLYEPEAIRRWFVPLIEALLPSVLPRIGVESFALDHTELQLTGSYHGQYYKAHHDHVAEEANKAFTRRVSFVYYFNLPGGAFSGGDLRLYDRQYPELTDTRHRYTAVAPLDNRLILFPSTALHEVMRVEAPSGTTEDARYTLNGWVHTVRA